MTTPPALLTRIIPSTGEVLPAIGLGTYLGFDVAPDSGAFGELRGVLEALFSAGGKVIDSSPMYGRAEEACGHLLTQTRARRRAFLATKVWTSGRKAGIAQIEDSFRLLQADTIDLFQVHNLLDCRTHLATLRALQEAGRVRYVGVTHYTSSAYAELEKVMREEALDFIQIDYSALERGADARILPLAAERGMAVLVNRPLGGGRGLRALARTPVPAWAGDYGCTTWTQLLLKFILGHPAVTCVIPGTGNAAHMRDNMQAGFGPLPDAAARKRIAASANEN